MKGREIVMADNFNNKIHQNILNQIAELNKDIKDKNNYRKNPYYSNSDICKDNDRRTQSG